MSFGSGPFGASPFGAQSPPDADYAGVGGVTVVLSVDEVVHIISSTGAWRWLMDRFADRVAGSNLLPFTVLVKTADQRAFDLTGASALFTLTRVGSAAPAVDSKPHTNTPGAEGAFEYAPAVGEVDDDGEYRMTVKMTILGKSQNGRFGVRILPDF